MNKGLLGRFCTLLILLLSCQFVCGEKGTETICDDGKLYLEADLEPFTCEGDKWPVSSTYVKPAGASSCTSAPILTGKMCMDAAISYSTTPPWGGHYRPLAPRYGEYRYLPPQRWTHSLMYGALVFLYHPCVASEDVEDLRSLARGCLRKHIITPYPHLTRDMPLAVVSYGCVYRMKWVDTEEAEEWVLEHALKTRESHQLGDGPYDYDLKTPSAIVSDGADSNVCLHKQSSSSTDVVDAPPPPPHSEDSATSHTHSTVGKVGNGQDGNDDADGDERTSDPAGSPSSESGTGGASTDSPRPAAAESEADNHPGSSHKTGHDQGSTSHHSHGDGLHSGGAGTSGADQASEPQVGATVSGAHHSGSKTDTTEHSISSPELEDSKNRGGGGGNNNNGTVFNVEVLDRVRSHWMSALVLVLLVALIGGVVAATVFHCKWSTRLKGSSSARDRRKRFRGFRGFLTSPGQSPAYIPPTGTPKVPGMEKQKLLDSDEEEIL